MLFKATTVVSAMALFFASQSMASPIAAEVTEGSGNGLGNEFGILIAIDPYYACNCPNNCDHHVGSSCKYHNGPADNSPVVSGKCRNDRGRQLTCIPN
ncbi:hypothetical protein PT974_00431 [Cladobotryum mycophilum]|uniref:Antifungal protein n=1 Tax=Cladobotryum mycophilum TaxID=491253 RepID=A0ABR0T212_9HYPO